MPPCEGAGIDLLIDGGRVGLLRSGPCLYGQEDRDETSRGTVRGRSGWRKAARRRRGGGDVGDPVKPCHVR